MIGFLVRRRVRIKIRIRVRVGVTFNVGVYHGSNCRRSKMLYIPVVTCSCLAGFVLSSFSMSVFIVFGSSDMYEGDWRECWTHCSK